MDPPKFIPLYSRPLGKGQQQCPGSPLLLPPHYFALPRSRGVSVLQPPSNFVGCLQAPQAPRGLPKCLISGGRGRKAKGELSAKLPARVLASPSPNPLPVPSLRRRGRFPCLTFACAHGGGQGSAPLSALRPLRGDGATALTPGQPSARPGLTPLLLGRDVASAPGTAWPGRASPGTGSLLLPVSPQVCNCLYCSLGRCPGGQAMVVLLEMEFAWAASMEGDGWGNLMGCPTAMPCAPGGS